VLTNCGNFPGQVNGAGTNYTGAEVEPWVDVNPTDRMNIVAVWQQDRWSNGGSRGTVAGVSHDGGGTWTIVPIPGFTDCGGGIFQRASDPWVSFDPYGVAHQMTLVINLDPPAREPGGFGFNGMVTSRSMDGGLTWGEPILMLYFSRGLKLPSFAALSHELSSRHCTTNPGCLCPELSSSVIASLALEQVL